MLRSVCFLLLFYSFSFVYYCWLNFVHAFIVLCWIRVIFCLELIAEVALGCCDYNCIIETMLVMAPTWGAMGEHGWWGKSPGWRKKENFCRFAAGLAFVEAKTHVWQEFREGGYRALSLKGVLGICLVTSKGKIRAWPRPCLVREEKCWVGILPIVYGNTLLSLMPKQPDFR